MENVIDGGFVRHSSVACIQLPIPLLFTADYLHHVWLITRVVFTDQRLLYLCYGAFDTHRKNSVTFLIRVRTGW
jgi:hypothetical protein